MYDVEIMVSLFDNTLLVIATYAPSLHCGEAFEVEILLFISQNRRLSIALRLITICSLKHIFHMVFVTDVKLLC